MVSHGTWLITTKHQSLASRMLHSILKDPYWYATIENSSKPLAVLASQMGTNDVGEEISNSNHFAVWCAKLLKYLTKK